MKYSFKETMAYMAAGMIIGAGLMVLGQRHVAKKRGVR